MLVHKAGGVKNKDYRMCIDYRKVNKRTQLDAYPIPLIDDCLQMCRGAKWITTIDIKDAYHHIPMAEDSRQYTAFATSKGLFEWNVMPFGLYNAPATFQRHVDNILTPFVGRSVAAYFDDVIIYSSGTLEEHMKIVVEVLQTLSKNKLQASSKKCKFAMKEVKILGHYIKNGTILPDPDKINAITKFPRPTNVTELKPFLGLAGYYRKFISHSSLMASPLYELTRKNVPFDWSQNRLMAFEKIKHALTHAPASILLILLNHLFYKQMHQMLLFQPF